jgi:hypothetical protein
MSQDNVELALRAYDAFNRRDWDAFVALMDDDVEIVTRIAAIEGGRLHRLEDAQAVAEAARERLSQS